jgi:hypothetical protein
MIAMTEQQWQTCDDPEPMLEFLQGKASDRKLRLFAAACCWERGTLLKEEVNRRCLSAFVRFADGEGSRRAARAARRAAEDTWMRDSTLHCPDVTEDAWVTAAACSGPANPTELFGGPNHNAAQARLLRCVFNDPFCPVPLDPLWKTPGVTALARAAHEGDLPRSGFLDSAHLAVLSDALEEAGCDDERILAHLRDAGLHVRGCWVIDLILGKT